MPYKQQQFCKSARTMRQLRALDLFCGGGGATKGLQRSGFHVTGVDIKPQKPESGRAASLLGVDWAAGD